LRRSADGLLDQAVEPEMQQRIDAVLARFAKAPLRFDHLTTRRAGSRRFVDLHLHMPAEWTLAQAAGLRGEVEQALMAAVPGLRATIQLLPLDVETHQDDAEAKA
jgi:divalent metal cation (Fe/Co/Zn/Cd) transporter